MTIKDFSQTVYDLLTSKITYTDQQLEELDKASVKLFNEIGQDLIFAQIKKILNLNILCKDVNFRIFEKLPNVWKAYFLGAIVITGEK